MNIETEQLLAAAARVELAWHYARLLSPLLQREHAILTRRGNDSEQIVRAQAELAALSDRISALRAEADHVGVTPYLDRALDALASERRLLATAIATQLREISDVSDHDAGWETIARRAPR
jgi:hypothetical protein